MEKLFELAGLKKPKYKFNDFELNLRIHYLINFGIDLGLIIFIIVFALLSKYYSSLWIFVAIFIILTATHVYNLFQLLGGQVMVFDGECGEVEKNVKTFMKRQILGKSNVEVIYDDSTYIVPVGHNSNFKKGSVVRVYYTEGEIYQKDDDTYMIPNPVYVTKVKN